MARMLKVRLQRFGKKHAPIFRVVLTDSKNSTISGRFKEVLGTLDPKRGKPEVKDERVLYWISKGAQLTPTVHNLMIKTGVIRGKKIAKGAHSSSAIVKDSSEAKPAPAVIG